MAVSNEYLDFVTEQLKPFGEIEIKRMFGGVGIFKDGLMFGKIGDDIFRLKADDHNKKDYEDRGMTSFFSANKKKGMPYWEVPEDVLADKRLLAEWAHKAYEAAVRSKK